MNTDAPLYTVRAATESDAGTVAAGAQAAGEGSQITQGRPLKLA